MERNEAEVYVYLTEKEVVKKVRNWIKNVRKNSERESFCRKSSDFPFRLLDKKGCLRYTKKDSLDKISGK